MTTHLTDPPFNTSSEPSWVVRHELLGYAGDPAKELMVVSGGAATYTTPGTDNVQILFCRQDAWGVPKNVTRPDFPTSECYTEDCITVYVNVPYDVVERFWLEHGA